MVYTAFTGCGQLSLSGLQDQEGTEKVSAGIEDKTLKMWKRRVSRTLLIWLVELIRMYKKLIGRSVRV